MGAARMGDAATGEVSDATVIVQAELKTFQSTIADLHEHGSLLDLPALDLKCGETMRRFAADVLKILSLVADTSRPKTWDEFLTHGFADAP